MFIIKVSNRSNLTRVIYAYIYWDVVEKLANTNKHGLVDNHFKASCIQVKLLIGLTQAKDFNEYLRPVCSVYILVRRLDPTSVNSKCMCMAVSSRFK